MIFFFFMMFNLAKRRPACLVPVYNCCIKMTKTVEAELLQVGIISGDNSTFDSVYISAEHGV